MFFQRILAWTLLAAHFALALYGFSTIGLFSNPPWSAQGLIRFVIFVLIYAAVVAIVVMKAPRRLPAVLAVTVIGYSAAAVGPLAPLAVIYILASCYCTGAFWMRKRPKSFGAMPHALMLLGLATWILVVTLTARWGIHYWWAYAVLLALPIGWAAVRRVLLSGLPPAPDSRGHALLAAIPLLPLLAHWLVALKPEASGDGLSMHLVVAARMAAHHAWAFDVNEFLWAVKPMGAEWAYSIAYLLGGEGAARLLNWAVLAVLCWLLHDWLHLLAPARLAALFTAAFAATPLVQFVTGSMHVENFVAAFVLASVAFLRRYRRTKKPGYFYAAALLAGVAASCTPMALAFVLPLVAAFCVMVPFRTLFPASLLGFCVGVLPYCEAWVRTGNPVFPFFNSYFRSQLFDTATDFRGDRVDAPLSWTTWFDLTFDTSRFFDGGAGSLGFFLFLFAPLCLVAFRRNWPRTAWVLLWTSLAGLPLSFLADAHPRHLYTAIPLLTVLIGIMTATFRSHSAGLERCIGALAMLTLFLHLALLPTAGDLHADFSLNQVIDRASRERYLSAHAPERLLVDHLNESAPGARVAWMESNAIGDFPGPTVTNSWHSPEFQRRLAQSTSAQGHFFMATETGLEYFIAPTAENTLALTNVHTRGFLDDYTRLVLEAGGMELRRLEPRAGLYPSDRPHAPPGIHDELNSYARYEGPWMRETRMPRAYRGTLAHTIDARSRVTIRFRGSAITPLYTAAANRCATMLILDGGEPIPFSQFAEETHWQARGPRLMTEPGEHALEIRMSLTGEARSPLLGCHADLDGFVVE